MIDVAALADRQAARGVLATALREHRQRRQHAREDRIGGDSRHFIVELLIKRYTRVDIATLVR